MQQHEEMQGSLTKMIHGNDRNKVKLYYICLSNWFCYIINGNHYHYQTNKIEYEP